MERCRFALANANAFETKLLVRNVCTKNSNLPRADEYGPTNADGPRGPKSGLPGAPGPPLDPLTQREYAELYAAAAAAELGS